MDQKTSPQNKSKKLSFFLGIVLGSILAIGSVFFLVSSFLHHYSVTPTSIPTLIALHKQDFKREMKDDKKKDISVIETPSTSPLRSVSSPQKPNKASLALVFVGVGPDTKTLLRALKVFPKQVSFSFAPFTPEVSEWILKVHQRGFEVLLDLPLESAEFPQLNKGPYTLLKDAPESENLSKLALILEKGHGEIVGLYGFMGSRICNSKKDMYPILKTLKKKGYMFLGHKTPHSCIKPLSQLLNLPYVPTTQFLEGDESEENLKENLQNLENKARKQGVVVGVAYLQEASFETLKMWLETLHERDITLIPVSKTSQGGAS
ncbi:MAG: hypothetical protein B7Y25_00425 [Alphaproteobacteria bacterium 16-39-46]|nr:MAG: hypothetical protein B7Y25_00425 [Alphaproteobacteria bacterium 16-39-46]OZA44433.1 MAG: hypothetical protein B7X84_00495 [Alphaproteobacteria bacterium 17-39-52]HQS83319.1 divergent polysaccharide deacetylase family protein [Alphaproteobacteria bacterium]HQS93139.1 divergent polysaccharide deacetylase family protein [Alphaproteobacteria bacterium]